MLRIPLEGGRIDSERPEPVPQAIRGWIDEARAGSGPAFDALARHFLPRLRRWALVRTGDVDEAEDVVQATLVRAWSRLGSLDQPDAMSVWLYRILSNVTGERRRKARVRSRTLARLRSRLGPVSDLWAAPGFEDATGRELTALVRTFMETLSARQRIMLDLVDLQGLTPAEAARMLEINENTARVHLHRARRRMRTRILESCPEALEDRR